MTDLEIAKIKNIGFNINETLETFEQIEHKFNTETLPHIDFESFNQYWYYGQNVDINNDFNKIFNLLFPICCTSELRLYSFLYHFLYNNSLNVSLGFILRINTFPINSGTLSVKYTDYSSRVNSSR